MTEFQNSTRNSMQNDLPYLNSEAAQVTLQELPSSNVNARKPDVGLYAKVAQKKILKPNSLSAIRIRKNNYTINGQQRGESPSQGDLTKRWQFIKESAKAKKRIKIQDGAEYGSQNSSIDTGAQYKKNILPARRNRYDYVPSKVAASLARQSS